jgi:hypothetical protein
MRENKTVFMYGTLAINHVAEDLLDNLSGKTRHYYEERILEASYVKDDTFKDLADACDRLASMVREVENNIVGDSTAFRIRIRKLMEIKNILHIAFSYPERAIARLKDLPRKKLVNA